MQHVRILTESVVCVCFNTIKGILSHLGAPLVPYVSVSGAKVPLSLLRVLGFLHVVRKQYLGNSLGGTHIFNSPPACSHYSFSSLRHTCTQKHTCTTYVSTYSCTQAYIHTDTHAHFQKLFYQKMHLCRSLWEQWPISGFWSTRVCAITYRRILSAHDTASGRTPTVILCSWLILMSFVPLLEKLLREFKKYISLFIPLGTQDDL